MKVTRLSQQLVRVDRWLRLPRFAVWCGAWYWDDSSRRVPASVERAIRKRS